MAASNNNVFGIDLEEVGVGANIWWEFVPDMWHK